MKLYIIELEVLKCQVSKAVSTRIDAAKRTSLLALRVRSVGYQKVHHVGPAFISMIRGAGSRTCGRYCRAYTRSAGPLAQRCWQTSTRRLGFQSHASTCLSQRRYARISAGCPPLTFVGRMWTNAGNSDDGTNKSAETGNCHRCKILAVRDHPTGISRDQKSRHPSMGPRS